MKWKKNTLQNYSHRDKDKLHLVGLYDWEASLKQDVDYLVDWRDHNHRKGEKKKRQIIR